MLSKQENRYYQLEELEILKEFQRVCEIHHLRYFVTAGTLLGTIRHKGFIPWDDDIDIAMPRKDFEALRTVCTNELNSHFFYQDSHTDPCYPFYFAKIRKNGTTVEEPWLQRVPMHKGIYIDIFPLDVCPRSEWRAKVFFKAIELLTFSVVGKIDTEFRCGYKKQFMRLLYKCLKTLPLSVLFGVRDTIRKIIACSEADSRLCTVGGAHGYPRETYEQTWFTESQAMTFEGITVPVPTEWKKVLTSMYGDYLTPPSMADRGGHFI